MHLAPRVQAAQLEARATSEPITKRRQKEPKTEGKRNGTELAGYAVLQKKGQRRRRQLRTLLSRTSVFAITETLQWVIGNR